MTRCQPPRWTMMPDAAGWWFFTPQREHWKVALAVWVAMIRQETGQLWFQRRDNLKGYDGRMRRTKAGSMGRSRFPALKVRRKTSHPSPNSEPSPMSPFALASIHQRLLNHPCCRHC
jgi:hypothetical protein